MRKRGRDEGRLSYVTHAHRGKEGGLPAEISRRDKIRNSQVKLSGAGFKSAFIRTLGLPRHYQFMSPLPAGQGGHSCPSASQLFWNTVDKWAADCADDGLKRLDGGQEK